MTREEILKKEKEINETKKNLEKQLKNISEEEYSLAREKRNLDLKEAEEYVEFLKKNKEIILKIAPPHARKDCSDKHPINGYMDNEYPYCKRCMLLSVLNGEWTYKVSFDIEFKEI